MGVTSRMREILRPAEASARSADSRPAPGPLTITVTFLSPCSMALAAASPAATWAANGVDLRLPLKPRAPAEDQATTFPETSVMVMMVLLNVDWMWTTPLRMFFLLLRFLRGASPSAGSVPAGAAAAGTLTSSAMGSQILFQAAGQDRGAGVMALARTMPRFGPLRVRALVWVR